MRRFVEPGNKDRLTTDSEGGGVAAATPYRGWGLRRGRLQNQQPRWLLYTWVSAVGVLAGLLGFQTPMSAGEMRSFSLGTATVVLEDATPDVPVYFRSMRLNRSLNVWNVEVVISNASSRVLGGPFIVHVTNFLNTAGPLDFDGTQDGRPFYDVSAFVAGGELSPGETSSARTISLGVTAGAPVMSSAVFVRGSSVAAVALTQTLDDSGQPLPEVQVVEVGPAGSRALTTDPQLGLATLGGVAGGHTWRFEHPGYLPVWRQSAVGSNSVGVVANPRLTRSSTNAVDVTSAGSEVTAGAVTLRFPANAFIGSSRVTVTPLSGQTLPALLPQGWSPLQAFWVETGDAPSQPISASMKLWGAVNAGEPVAWVRLNTNTVGWETVGTTNGSGSDVMTVPLPGAGAYAFVVGDNAPLAPPAAVAGGVLQPSSAAAVNAGALSASGVVDPPTSAASRVAELVTANATATFSNAAPLPSGVLLRTEVVETYQMQDGSRRITPGHHAFISAYQRPGDGVANTLHAHFPMRPLLLLSGDELLEARVRVEVMAESGVETSLLNTNGGELGAGGVRLIAGAGAVPSLQAGYLRLLDVTNVAGVRVGTNEVVLAFEVGVGALAGRLTPLLPGATSNDLFVLARVITQNGVYGFEPVERFSSDSSGRVSSMEPVTGDRLPGVRVAGTYVLLRVAQPQGLVHGIVRGGTGTPQADLLVRLNPWLTFSDAVGVYRLLAGTGTVQVAVTDLRSGDDATATSIVEDSAEATVVDLSARQSGPRVVSVSPAASATRVSRVTPVLVTFNEPVNVGTVVSGGVQLIGTNGQMVGASVSLNLRQTTVTLLPASPLDPSTRYVIRVSTNVTDTGGFPLEGNTTFEFTTETDALARTGAQFIIYEPTNGLAAVFGSPGSADPEAPVILVNETTGATATILSRPDGSFTNFIAAGVDDFISAVLVNQNGTRTTLPAHRQIFRDGRVGLYNGGGILEAQSDGGPVQVLVEPGAVKTKSTFKLTPIPLDVLLASLPNPPVDAQVIAGFNYGMGGDEFSGGSDVSLTVDPAKIQLPDGAPPEEGAYALAMVRHLEGGGVVYQVVDKLKYEDGKLTSNTAPFQGIGDAFTDAIASNPLGVLGMVLNPTESIIQAAFTVLVLGNRPVTVTGRVGMCPAFAAGGCIDEALDPYLQGFEQFAPSVLEGVAEELVQATRRPLQGAFVTLSAPNQPTALRGRLQPGLTYTTSRRDGVYALVMPTANAGYVLRATHPRFAEKQAVPLRPTVDYQLGAGAVKKNFTFEVPVPADTAPRVDISHTPLFPATNQQAVLTIDAIHPTTPTILVLIESVQGGLPGDISLIQEPSAAPAPNQTRKIVRVSSAKAVTPKLKISVVTTNDTGGTVTIFHHIPIGQVPPAVTNLAIQSDQFDKTPPQIERTEPLANGLLTFGKPLVLTFNEPIDRGVLNQGSQFTINDPNLGTPVLSLSDDQTRLEIQFVGLKPGAEYELTTSAEIKDIAGNKFIPPPSALGGGTTYKLKFRTLPMANGSLSGVGSGGGVVVHHNFAYVLDRGQQQRLLVYDISNPLSPLLVSSSFTFIAMPRDLTLIPKWAHVRKRGEAPLTNDMLAVVIGDLGSESIDKEGNVFFEGQLLRIIDISNPANPTLVRGVRLTLRPNAITKVRWDPPMLSFFEIGSDLQQVGLIDLQEMLIGLSSTPAEIAAFPLFGIKGRDEDQNGDYLGPNDRLPTPPKEPIDFFGRGKSFLPPGNNGTRPWTDYDYKFRGDYAGVVFRGGVTVDQLGNPTTTALNPGYRTLAFAGDIDAPTATVTFGPKANPKRVFGLLNLNIGTTEIPNPRHVALVSLAPDDDGISKLAVIDITQPSAPVLTNKIEFPTSLDLGFPQSVTRRDDGILALAMTKDLVLLDSKRLFFQVTNGTSHPAILQVIPGAGSGNISLDGNSAGVNVVALGARNQVVLTAPTLAFARVLRNGMTDPALLAGNTTLRAEVMDALRTTTVVSPARFRAVGGAVSTLNPANPTNHYHVLVRAPGGAGATIKVGLQALNRSGYPLRSKGRGFAAVRAVSGATSTQLGQQPRPGCDAPAEALTAYQLSNDVNDPLYNLYLTVPFALVYEKLAIAEVNALRGSAQTPVREILWSDFYMEAFLDVEMQGNAVLGTFAARVTGAAENMDRILLPRASAVAETFPGTYIMGPNPPPLTGEMKIPGTFGMLSAHNGEFRHDTVDIALPGRRMPIVVERTIGGQDLYEGAFGRGWDFSYAQRLTPLKPEIIGRDHLMPQLMRALSTESVIAKPEDLLWLNGAGRIVLFTNAASNGSIPSAVVNDPLFIQLGWSATVRTYYLPAAQDAGVFDPLFEFQDGQFARLTPDGRQFWYDRRGTLTRIYHRYTDNFHKLTYNERGELAKIVDGSIAEDKRFVEFGYYRLQGDAERRLGLDEITPHPFVAGKIARLKDYAGRVVTYAYTPDGVLEKRSSFGGSTANGGEAGPIETSYLLGDDCSPNFQGVLAGSGSAQSQTPLFTAPLTQEGELSGGGNGAGGPVTISLPPNNSAAAMQGATTTTTGPDGATTSVTFDKTGRPATVELRGLTGDPAPHQIVYNSVGLVQSITYPLGSSVTYAYDTNNATLRARANLLSEVRAPGGRPGNPVTRTISSYDLRYNLPDALTTDFNLKSVTYTLTGDGKDVQSIAYENAGSLAFQYNSFGQMDRRTAPDGIVIDPEYDNSTGFKTFESHGTVRYTYGYDGVAGDLGVPTRIQPIDGPPTELTYDDRLLVLTAKRGAYVERRGYDKNGYPKRISIDAGDSRTRVETRVYNQVGFLEEVTLENVVLADGSSEPLVTKFVSTPQDAWRVRKIVYPGGQERTFDYDHLGNVVKTTLGAYVEDFVRDAHGNVLEFKQGGVITRSMEYDGYDRVKFVRRPGAGGVEVTEMDYFGDGTPSLYKVTDPRFNIVRHTVATSIDGLGRVRSRTHLGDAVNATYGYNFAPGSFSVQGPLDSSTTTFDSGGRTLSFADSLASVAFTPNANGTVRSMSSQEGSGPPFTADFGYDGLNYLSSMSDPIGSAGSFTVLPDGSLKEVRDGAGNTTTHTYSTLGEKLTEERANGVKFKFGYDKNRKLAYAGDDQGGHTISSDSTTFRFDRKELRSSAAYDVNGVNNLNLPLTMGIPGGTATMGYDTQGRLTTHQVNFPGGNFQINYIRDALGRNREVTYGANGPVNTAKYTYDKLGPLTRAEYIEALGTFTVSSESYADGTRQTLIYPNNSTGQSIAEIRDNGGRLLRITANDGELYRVSTFATATTPSEAFLGGGLIRQRREVDRRRRETARRYEHAGTGTLLADIRQTYDLADNRTLRQEVHRHGRADRYEYDAGNRLSRADFGLRPSVPGSIRLNSAGLRSQSGLEPGMYGRIYTYDSGGLDLLRSVTNVNPSSAALVSPPIPFVNTLGAHDNMLYAREIDGVPRGGADPLGNAGGGTLFVRERLSATAVPVAGTFTFNGLGQLLNVVRADGVVVSYEQAPDMRLHRRTVRRGNSLESDRAIVFDGKRILEEYDAASGSLRLVARYYYADEDSPFAADLADSSGTLRRYFMLKDAQQSVVALADTNGVVVERMQYDAWGQPLIQGRDQFPSVIAQVVGVSSNEWLVQFTEPVMPPLENSGSGFQLVTTTRALSNLFEITFNGSPVAVNDVVYAEDALPGGFGSVFRVRLGATINGVVTVRVRGGALLDEWGITNAAQQIFFTNAPSGLLFTGPAFGSTAAPMLARSAVGSPFLFHGQYFDYDTGLIYMRARFYDPYTGQFLSQDPLGYEDSVNLYAGFRNNPVTYRDPTGLAAGKGAPPKRPKGGGAGGGSSGGGNGSPPPPKRPPHNPHDPDATTVEGNPVHDWDETTEAFGRNTTLADQTVDDMNATTIATTQVQPGNATERVYRGMVLNAEGIGRLNEQLEAGRFDAPNRLFGTRSDDEIAIDQLVEIHNRINDGQGLEDFSNAQLRQMTDEQLLALWHIAGSSDEAIGISTALDAFAPDGPPYFARLGPVARRAGSAPGPDEVSVFISFEVDAGAGIRNLNPDEGREVTFLNEVPFRSARVYHMQETSPGVYRLVHLRTFQGQQP